jgi:hypothetical protein
MLYAVYDTGDNDSWRVRNSIKAYYTTDLKQAILYAEVMTAPDFKRPLELILKQNARGAEGYGYGHFDIQQLLNFEQPIVAPQWHILYCCRIGLFDGTIREQWVCRDIEAPPQQHVEVPYIDDLRARYAERRQDKYGSFYTIENARRKSQLQFDSVISAQDAHLKALAAREAWLKENNEEPDVPSDEPYDGAVVPDVAQQPNQAMVGQAIFAPNPPRLPRAFPPDE